MAGRQAEGAADLEPGPTNAYAMSRGTNDAKCT